jgi:hypothetical protein
VYVTPEVEIAAWKLACEKPEDALRLLKEQIEAHPGMLAPFTAMVNHFTSECEFRQAVKLSVTQQQAKRPFWQARHYDFNVFTAEKTTEKLRYMHRNPVVRELCRLVSR